MPRRAGAFRGNDFLFFTGYSDLFSPLFCLTLSSVNSYHIAFNIAKAAASGRPRAQEKYHMEFPFKSSNQ